MIAYVEKLKESTQSEKRLLRKWKDKSDLEKIFAEHTSNKKVFHSKELLWSVIKAKNLIFFNGQVLVVTNTQKCSPSLG